MNYNEALEYIYNTSKYGSKLGLQNITELLKRLGDPQESFPSVHIAGTNGKGSVSVMITSMLKQAGYRVGMFVSPYLERFTERIQINFQEIPEDALVNLIELVREQINGMVEDGFNHPTEFEIVTALGFLWFARQKVDIAVVEVGLGGRLDATNVIKPLVSVITSISYDHTHILGSSLSDIAYEKGGIIKSGVPVVSYPQPEEAEKVIAALAEKRGCFYHLVSTDQVRERCSFFHEQHFDFTWKTAKWENLTISLSGKHQQLNAACALSCIMILKESGYNVPNEAIYTGLKYARWPGRLEMVRTNPAILLDGAHNPSGAAVLADTVKQYFKDKKIHLLLGILQDKDVESVTKTLCNIADCVTITQSSSPRSTPSEELAFIAKKYHWDVKVCPNLEDAIIHGLRWTQQGVKEGEGRTDDRMLIISGSLYLIGEARTILINEKYQLDK